MASSPKRQRINWLWVLATSSGGIASTIYGLARTRDLNTAPFLLGCVSIALILALYFLWRSLHVLIAEEPQTQEEVKQVEGRMRRDLQREKRFLLKALAELELDYEMGKLSEKDFRDASANYRARIARIFRQLDAGADYEALVKEELARRKRQKPTDAAAEPEKKAEPVAAPPAEIKPTATERRTCGKCSTSNEPDAEFCKKCGGALS